MKILPNVHKTAFWLLQYSELHCYQKSVNLLWQWFVTRNYYSCFTWNDTTNLFSQSMIWCLCFWCLHDLMLTLSGMMCFRKEVTTIPNIVDNVSDCCALFSVRFEKIISSQKESAMILREHSDTYLRTIRIHSCNEIFNFNKKSSQIFLNHVCSFYYRVASSISTRNQMSSKKESSMILRTASFILQ